MSVEWNGYGLPRVGVTCEHCPGGATQHEWEVVTVIAISDRPGGIFTDYWLMKEDGSSYVIGNPYRFRPLRAEAERKRSDICDRIYGAMTKADRKDNRSDMAEAVYDAIAAGIIPGVKLE